jgi:hypothetical protein
LSIKHLLCWRIFHVHVVETARDLVEYERRFHLVAVEGEDTRVMVFVPHYHDPVHFVVKATVNQTFEYQAQVITFFFSEFVKFGHEVQGFLVLP